MLRVWSAKTLCLRSPMATRGALVRFDAVRAKALFKAAVLSEPRLPLHPRPSRTDRPVR